MIEHRRKILTDAIDTETEPDIEALREDCRDSDTDSDTDSNTDSDTKVDANTVNFPLQANNTVEKIHIQLMIDDNLQPINNCSFYY